MNHRTSYILEIIWLVIAIICVLIGIRKTIQDGLGESYMLFILAGVSFIMYSLRHYLRKSQKNK